MFKRGSGILLHITSLPSRYGIGDFGTEAFRFADFLAEAGQTFWQVLPLNPINAAHGSSPYSSISTFAGNRYLISPDFLVRDGFLTEDDLAAVPAFPEGGVDYEAAAAFKDRLLDTVWERVRESGRELPGFPEFCRDNAWWLDDFALFTALKTRFGGQSWRDWPEPVRNRDAAALESYGAETADEAAKQRFVQFLFFRQWQALKGYCNERGIRIVGDLPIYVNYDSVDVWTLPHLFKLDGNRQPRCVAGVPPDYFSQTGQLWGNPVYDWDALRESGFAWWIKRMEQMYALYNVVRIDHFRGLVAYWEVDAHERTAVNGRWVGVPSDDFFNALRARFGELPVIVEDLGMITPDVHEVAERFGFPGMKVLLFAFNEDNPSHPYLPHNYSRNFVVYTGTHDTNTARGWFDREAGPADRERFFRYMGRKVPARDASREMLRLALRSVADLAIVPMQDVLGLGAGYRMNRPGTSKGNWKWRLLPGQASPELAGCLREMTRTYGR